MIVTVEDNEGAEFHVSCAPDGTLHEPGIVYLDPFLGEYAPLEMDPTKARKVAVHLLRAADEAEGVGNHFAALRQAMADYDAARYAEESVLPGQTIVDTLERWFPEAEGA
jgi:hypothetical protein